MAHLLCAYLNGIYFNLQILDEKSEKEGFKQLIVEMYCPHHTPFVRKIQLYI